MNYNVREIKSLDKNLKSIKNLYKNSSWDWLEPDDEMIKCFENSFTIYGGYLNNELVSLARTISDTKIYALVVDVIVTPKLRSKGLGNILIEYLIKDLKSKNVKVIQLLSSESGKALYLKNGFQECPEKSPGMILFPQKLK